MDHFNAMFEDASTKSWWRQENGEAIAGPLKGQVLPEMACAQMTLKQWLRYHPNSKIMQADTTYAEEYKHQRNFENGNKKGKLTRTDTLFWKDKSWVVGIQVGKASKAFDWNALKAKGIINDQVGNTPIVLALAKDEKSFTAFERPNGEKFSLKNDTLITVTERYNWLGKREVAPPLNSAFLNVSPRRVPRRSGAFTSTRIFPKKVNQILVVENSM